MLEHSSNHTLAPDGTSKIVATIDKRKRARGGNKFTVEFRGLGSNEDYGTATQAKRHVQFKLWEVIALWSETDTK